MFRLFSTMGGMTVPLLFFYISPSILFECKETVDFYLKIAG
jgi:hypothetical protein